MELELAKLRELAKTVRILSAEGVQAANSGHPGMPMGMADAAAVLWASFLRFNPLDPEWLGRDRFVLSAGHGSMLLYSLLHLFGYEVGIDDLKRFRQWGSLTPGHPEFGLTPGVETTTGPLGQGFANGLGLALSGKLLAQRYNRDLFNYTVYGIVSDGDLMEGITSEAASLAGHLKLSNIVYLYDDNHISIGGRTDVTFTENVAKRFEAYGWYVQSCDGNELEAVAECLHNARQERERPSLVCAHTKIGFGSPNKADSAQVHGAPLGVEELRATKAALGWPLDPPFYVPERVVEFCRSCIESKSREYGAWQQQFKAWSAAQTEDAAAFLAQTERLVPAALKSELLSGLKEPKKAATRALSGQAIQVIAKHIPAFIGGSADLEPSTNTLIKDAVDVQASSFEGRNIRFGVREHAMGALANGLAYTRCWIPYTATFLVFADYMRPTLRLAALSHLQTLFIFTHDSFYVGEDGPTHQPIEHIAALRLIPNLHVFRPADGAEVALCYWAALNRKNGPSALLFTRQNLPALERVSGWNADDVLRGAYVVSGAECCELAIVATGSEVSLACEAGKLLAAAGIPARIVSMPCQELYLEQSAELREQILPARARKVSLEAGLTRGWERIVGSNGLLLGRETYGASAPDVVLAENFGFTPQAVAERVKSWLTK